ncbi:MAG TPA: hypothetical protein VGE74_13280 [Gemmata sp.]
MNAETMRCPTCRASQVRSDVCRRCKSDLGLLRELAERYAAARARCLSNLRHDRARAALADAQECLVLRDDAATRRLVAVCELLNGNWAPARFHAAHVLAAGAAGEGA